MSYACPTCGRTSHHPQDEIFKYCGACHVYEQDLVVTGWRIEDSAGDTHKSWASAIQAYANNDTLTFEEVGLTMEATRRVDVTDRIKHHFASISTRLLAVFLKLQDEVTDDAGYGGPVWHEAVIDGVTLRMNQSDFGEVMFGANKDQRGLLYILNPDDTWSNIATKDDSKTLDRTFYELVVLAERAEWTRL